MITHAFFSSFLASPTENCQLIGVHHNILCLEGPKTLMVSVRSNVWESPNVIFSVKEKTLGVTGWVTAMSYLRVL